MNVIVEVKTDVTRVFKWLLKAKMIDGAPILKQVRLADDHFVATDGVRLHAAKLLVAGLPNSGTAEIDVLSNFSVLIKDTTGNQQSLEKYDRALYANHNPEGSFPKIGSILPDKSSPDRRVIVMNADLLMDALSAMSGNVLVSIGKANEIVELHGHSLDGYSLYAAIMPKHFEKIDPDDLWRPE